ncbi:uncharacterized protein K02A2.6-like [Uranotaenia lowii]|uniref:uncharacterized protein K02A2.6-like n=1 Tax=Uranotaenia lowii TaxID=190385 RepID=UPI0024797DE4|nr:uncharacterized protein K02A2.6-like [Uranotaenia lowii]
MPRPGRYVLLSNKDEYSSDNCNSDLDDVETNIPDRDATADSNCDLVEETCAATVRHPTRIWSEGLETDRSESASKPDDRGPSSGINPDAHKQKTIDSFNRFGIWLTDALAAYQKGEVPPSFSNIGTPSERVDQAASSPIPERQPPVSEKALPVTYGASNNIRWDHVRRFPENIPANKMWESWCRFFQNFEMAASLGNAHSSRQKAQLLYISLSDQLQGIVNAFYLMPDLSNPSCFEDFVKNIEKHLLSMTDTSAEHDSFQAMKQGVDESVVTFHSRLVEKVRLCGYSREDQEKFVRTQLLKGITNRDVAKFARLSGSDVNFIVQSATREEAANIEASSSSSAFMINHRHKASYRQPLRRNDNFRRNFKNPPPKRSRFDDDSRENQRPRCPSCNHGSHRSSTCPALGLVCKSCGKKDHFARCCPNRRLRAIESDPKCFVVPEKKENEENICALSLNDVLIKCSVGSSNPIEFLIDSGADVNILAGKDWVCLKSQFDQGQVELQLVDHSQYNDLRAYASNTPIPLECAFVATIYAVGYKKPKIQAEFLVVQNGRCSLLGRKTASDLRLLEVGASVNICETLPEKDIFPKVPGVKVRFSIDRNIPPVRNAYYNVPAALRDGARQRLVDMEARGIIERVPKAPEWISGMSAVPKGKNDFRLVVNMRAPNTAIKREYYRLPLIDEMKVKLHGSKFFSKLDLSNAFYHLELDEESRELTTFLSEGGMYRFTRLMFGVNCAPEVFQKEMCRILQDIPNIIVYIDDILIYASGLEELRSTVAAVTKTLEENNLTLNREKCEFDKREIKFLGHLLNEQGFHIEDEKIRNIQQFREPTTASELRSFLGLASFVSPHIQHFSEISSPLWAVATTKSWSWGPTESKAFEEMKEKIIKCTTTLGYFSNEDRTILYTDASPML